MMRPHAEDAFDLRARAELALAFEPSPPPEQLFRRASVLRHAALRRGLAAIALMATAAGTVFAIRPPAVVRGAIEHEYYERTLRGNFMDAGALLAHLGLGASTGVPGLPQLMRPCDIEGHRVYHLTTFFERGGIVTVFAFEAPPALPDDSGWWNNVYWQVVHSRQGKPLIMVAQKKKALTVAWSFFGRSPI